MRQRAKKACVPCRRRKRKCDGQIPCRTCTEYEYECTYDVLGPRMDVSNERRLPSLDVPTGDIQSPQPSGSFNESADTGRFGAARTRGFLDASKSRYLNKESSVSFPRSLGLDLQTSNLPRLHAFAYHAGIRPEPGFSLHYNLPDHITLAQVQRLLGIYQSIVHPIFGFLDINTLSHQCDLHWKGDTQGQAFEAIISGVIGLASLFSDFLTQQAEAAVVDHAKGLLESPFWVSPPNIQCAMAWILRTIYLRATSRPHMAWLCSSITMHIAEAIGLHRNLEELTIVANPAGSSLQESTDTRERTFQVARSLNLIISYDYGRSCVNIGKISRGIISCHPGDFTGQLCGLVWEIATDDTVASSSAESTDLFSLLAKVFDAPADHDFIVLTRAELAFCIYRRVHYFGHSLKQEQVDQVIEIGVAALQAAGRLAAISQPWWNVLGTVFHFVCILLSINTNSTLQRVPEAVQTLQQVAQQLNTHTAMEALQTANDLIRASLEQKRKAVQNLETALTYSTTDSRFPTSELAFPELDWNSFLQPFDQDQFLPFQSLATG